MRRSFLFSALLCAALGAVAGAADGTHDLQERARLLLDAYARGDRAAVLSMVDGDSVTIYGSDAAEIFHGAAAIGKMLDDDQRLWGGAAKIGTMEHVTTVKEGNLASIFFDAPFSAGGRPAVPVRFAMVWKRSGKKWLLVQSSNVVPTRGQSAEELLKR